MKFGGVVIVALLLGAAGAHFLLADPGYVVVNFRGYIIEMSVPVLVGLIASVIVTVWLVYRLIRLPRKLGEAAGALRSQRAGRQFTRGLIAAAEGKLTKGERLLTRNAASAETPLLNYLAAARVAHQQGATERRDNWLTLAYEQTPGAANAVLLTQAELQLANAQYEQALATLKRIQDNVPGHQQASLLLGRTYAAIGDWKSLGSLLPALRKQGSIEAGVLDDWEREVTLVRLGNAGDDASALKSVWSGLGDALMRDPAVAERYVSRLAAAGAPGDAEAALRKILKKHWDGELVRLYGLTDGGATRKQLKIVEGWLATRGDDADLLLAAARLCLRESLWGKARSYAESSLALKPSPEAYRVYGELLSELGEDERAADAYRSGLGLVAGPEVAMLPRLERDDGEAAAG